MGLWFHALQEYLFTLDRRLSTLVERGVQIEKSTTFTVSHSHSVIRIDKLDTRVFSYEDPSPLDPVASLVAFDPDLQAKITAGLDPTSGKAAPLDSWVRRFLHLPGNWPA